MLFAKTSFSVIDCDSSIGTSMSQKRNATLAGDMEVFIDVILPNASPQMKELIVEQRRQLSAKGPCGHMWSKELITKCLSLCIRIPQGYRDLLDTGLVVLPSKSTLELHKNDVQQSSGFQDNIFHGMLFEAQGRALLVAI